MKLKIHSLLPVFAMFFLFFSAKDTKAMKTVGHKGYETIGLDRERVTRVFKSEKVKETIQKKGIKLIGYGI